MTGPLMKLPQELLSAIFEAQHTMADVFHLSQTCGLLQQTYRSHRETILSKVCRRHVPCYDQAVQLAVYQESIAQILPSSSNSLFCRILLNDREASRVIHEYAQYVNAGAIYGVAPDDARPMICAIHRSTEICSRTAPLFAYERVRIRHCWYFLKALAQTHDDPDPNQNRLHEMLQELDTMSINRLYMLFDQVGYLCECAPEDMMEDLGINDHDLADEMGHIQMYYQTLPWEQLRRIVTEKYVDRRNWGHDAYELKLTGPCENCLIAARTGECMERDEHQDLWELGP